MLRAVMVPLLALPLFASAAMFDATVVAVSDGDTITVTVPKPCEAGQSCFKGKRSYRVRLAEIDAPERKQPYGIEARDALSGAVLGQSVQVDDQGQRSYSRIVAHVYMGDLWLNRAMVADGYAWVDPRYSKSPELVKLVKKAKADQVGLWQLPDEQIVPPWVWRKSKMR